MRRFVIGAIVAATLSACSSGTGLESGRDPAVVGTWIQHLAVRDEFGGECFILAVRFALAADGTYRVEFYSADTRDPDCEPFLFELDTGAWSTSAGVLTFEPSLCCGAGGGGEYVVEGSSLTFGSFDLERES